MIGRRVTREFEEETVKPKGFDDFDLRLGDMMRGERATLGKSLLDVERELRIKAAYVSAIENSDPGAFDTPGFIPGYVRSYARYLGMDPDESFKSFCSESGFSIAHGMSAEASSRRKTETAKRNHGKRDPLIASSTPFLPETEGLFARIEPGAVGSALVLVALICGIGYGGWSVLNEVQRVKFAPVENTPEVLSDLDPLEGAIEEPADPLTEDTTAGIFLPPTDDRLDRLYRPEALDVPVMVARDAPISTLDPARVGALRPEPVVEERNLGQFEIAAAPVDIPSPQVVEEPLPDVRMVAVRPAWVRVRAADGSVIFEGILNAGDTYDVPATEQPPTLRAGDSGSIYFAVNGQHYGPVGERGSVTSGLALEAGPLMESYSVADLSRDQDLSSYVAELQSGATEATEPQE